ncbi:ABC transporter, permease family protein [Methylocaldum marinum]|uniref:ABC transporter, permease family protein n=1 Tax=Methylocaldum marinum TaxID=1432792 RepID=A0A286P4A3_9GAMM|nr:ABC transporter transmembrane domain-containing protein [Methylocaldum marinum]BBA37476.1 ABC transporter, permease family protein [Methylocaldum marinum]
MNGRQVLINRKTWDQFLRSVKSFAGSDVGGQAKQLFAGLMLLLIMINALNVFSSYVGRDFMTSIEHRNVSGFLGLGLLWIGVFVAASAVAAIFRFTEEKLGLLWREWLTRVAVIRYLERRTYFRLDETGRITNPDQRIAEDIRAFTATTLSFVLMVLNATFTVLAFSGVMLSISPILFAVTIAYAAGGSYLTVLLGRTLVELNYTQLDKEANFRSDLIHVRENAASVALLHRERQLGVRLLRHLDDLTRNFRRIIVVNRNLNFFTSGYNYLIQIIPALVVAPFFIQGRVEFGVITQSAMAFAHLVGAFSLIVTQFQSISSFAAVIARLGSLAEALRDAQAPERSVIEIGEGEHVAYVGLSLLLPRDGRPLIKDLTVSISPGTRVLVTGQSEEAKVALFRATAGIWDSGTGRIVRPESDQIYFLPERPYLPPGTLRELLVRGGTEESIPESRILAVLRDLALDSIPARSGGLDVERDWDHVLSLREQQRLAFARLLLAAPRFAFLDRMSTSLRADEAGQLLKMLSNSTITYVTFSRWTTGRRGTDEKLDNYDAVLELTGDGGWKWRLIQD